MRIRERSAIIVFSQALTQMSGIILGMVLVRIMTKADFGTFRQADFFVLFLLAILGLNIPHSLYYFLPQKEEFPSRTVIVQSVYLSLASALCVCAISWFCSDWIARWFENDRLRDLVKIFGLYAVGRVLIVLIPAYMICVGRPVRSGVYSFLSVFLRAALVVVLVLCGQSLEVIVLGIVILAFLIGAFGTWEMIRFSGEGSLAPDFRFLRTQLSFLLPLVASTVIGVINIQLGRFLISQEFSVEQFADYDCGSFQLPLVGIVTAGLTNAIMPELVQYGKKEAFDKAVNLWHKAIRKCSLIMYPSTAFLLFCSTDVILVLYGEKYLDAVYPFRILLLDLLLRVTVYGGILRAFGATRPIVISAAFSLGINLILSIGLMKLGQHGFLTFIAPCIASVIANAVSVAIMLVAIRKIIDKPLGLLLPWNGLVKVLMISSVSGALLLLLPDVADIPAVIRLSIKAVIFGISLISILWFTKNLEADEKQVLVSVAGRVRHFIRRK